MMISKINRQYFSRPFAMLKKIFLFFSAFIFIPMSSFGKQVTDRDVIAAKEILQKLGIDVQNIKIDKERMDWRDKCWGGLRETSEELLDNPDDILQFSVRVEKPIKVMGYSLGENANIGICDGKVVSLNLQVNSKGDFVPFLRDGYECDQYIFLDKNGHLCECRLAKDTVINGFTVPKGIEVVFRHGSPYAVLLSPETDKRLKAYPQGFYKIKNGKPSKFDSSYIKCDFSADPDPTKYDNYKD